MYLLWVPVTLLKCAVLLCGEDALALYANATRMQDHAPTAVARLFLCIALAHSPNDVAMVQVEAAVPCR